jgi:Tfp pilus assembly protein PilV
MQIGKLHAKNKEKGQSMFELVVAIAICALIIVAIVSLTTVSINNSSYSKNKALASTYAQQATEWLRGQRDSNIDTFIANATTPAWCLQDLGFTRPAVNPAVDCTGKITNTPFVRWVSFNTSLQGGKTVVEADITVSWSDSQGTHTVKSATNFSDWRQR